MKVILNSDIDNVGEEGDTVEISDGYARNYLLPKQLCLPYTPQNVSIIKSRQRAIEVRRKQKQEAALSLKERLEKLELRIPVPVGETGRLFGSVNNGSLSELLSAQGFDINRRNIELGVKHIKVIGTYTAKIKLYGSEYAQCTFTVVSDAEKASSDQDTQTTTASGEVDGNEEHTVSDSAAAEPVPTVAKEHEQSDSSASNVEETEHQITSAPDSDEAER